MQRSTGSAVISGVIAVVIGLVITFLVSLIWPTPWDLGQAMLAVAGASFFAAFFTAAYGRR